MRQPRPTVIKRVLKDIRGNLFTGSGLLRRFCAINRTATAFLAMTVFVGLNLAYASPPGSSTANFLKIGVGARADALAGAYSPISEDVSGIYWNPAALSLVHRPQFGFSYDRLVENISYQFGGYVLPITVNRSAGTPIAAPIRHETLGAGVYYLPVNNIDAYDVHGIPMGTVDTYDLAASLSYALLWPAYKNLSVGFTGKLIQKSLADKKASGLAIDVGTLFIPDRQFLGGDWRAAACVANLGTGLEFVSERNSFPLLWRLGLAYRHELLSNDLCASIQVTGASDNSPYVSIGLEYLVWHMFSLRIGYNSSTNLDKGFRAGAGISTDLLSLDYAYVPFGMFGNTHRFSLTFKFGHKPIGIARIRKMIERHYVLGCRYMQQDQLIAAYREFGQVLELNPVHNQAKTKRAEIARMFLKAKTVLEQEHRQKEIDEHIALGKKYFNSGDLIKAKQEFETILELDSKNMIASGYLKRVNKFYQEVLEHQVQNLFESGQAFFEKGLLKDAIQQFEKVLELKPAHKEAKDYLQRAYKQLEEIEKVKHEKQHKVRLEKLYNQGVRYFKQQKWNSTIESFKKLLSISKRYKDAQEYLKNARKNRDIQIEKDKAKAEEYYLEGLKEYTSGNIKKAISLWEKTLQLNPGHIKAKRGLERTRQELK